MKTIPLPTGVYQMRAVLWKNRVPSFYNVLKNGKVTYQLSLLPECNQPPRWQVRRLAPGLKPAEGWLTEIFSSANNALAVIENGGV